MSRVGRLLNRTVPVWRKGTIVDAGGGQKTIWQQVGTVRGRRSQPSARERTAAAQARAALDQIWYFAPSADVRRGDELRLAGQVWQVTATFEPSEDGTYLRADCTARQPTTGGP